MTMSRRFALALLLAVVACQAKQRTMLVVDIDSDLAVPGRLNKVDVAVTVNGKTKHTPYSLISQYRLPLHVGVVETSDGVGDITVVATGYLDPDPNAIVNETAIVGFIEGQSMELKLYLASECIVNSCTSTQTCTKGGNCRDKARKASDLTPFVPGTSGGTGANSGSGGSSGSGGNPGSAGSSSTGGTSVAGGTSGGGGGTSRSGLVGPSGGTARSGGAMQGGAAISAGGTSTGGTSPNGGTTGTGGASVAGGTSAGGTSPSGGTTGTGGAQNTGGASVAGGTRTGGVIGSGGAPGSGGSRATGGTSPGGATSTGGASKTGGATKTGGTGVGGTSGSGGATGGTTSTASSGSVPTIAGCNIFPADNPWNADISGYPLDPNGATYLANMSPSTGFLPDWGTVTDEYGIPFSTGTVVTPQPMTWNVDYGATESDQLPCATGSNKFCYPIPLTAPIEGGPTADTGSDRHVLYIDTAGAPNNCTLYELYNAQNPTGGSGWTASNGAIFHLGSDAPRTDGRTSADAAGLPILPGLVRYDEVMAGEIRHAIRFTVSRSQQGYIHPATHAAGNSSTTLPPMGLRMRLKASFDTSSFSGPTLVILTAMKKYGIILADNGSNWYISGESNEGWSSYMDDLVSNLRKVHGSDFEAVNTGPVLTDGL
jgi:hypothetical protein